MVTLLPGGDAPLTSSYGALETSGDVDAAIIKIGDGPVGSGNHLTSISDYSNHHLTTNTV